MSLRRVCDRSGTSDPAKLKEKYYFEYRLVKGLFADEKPAREAGDDGTNGTIVIEGIVDLCDECGVAVEAIVKEQIIGTAFVEPPKPTPASKKAAPTKPKAPAAPLAAPPVPKVVESTPEVKAQVAEIMKEVKETAEDAIEKANATPAPVPEPEPASEPAPEPEKKGIQPGKMEFGGVPGDDEEF